MNEFTGLNFCQNVTGKTAADGNCHDQSFGNLTAFTTNNFFESHTNPVHSPNLKTLLALFLALHCW